MAQQLSEDKALLRANELLLSAKNYALFTVSEEGAIDTVVDFTGMSPDDFGTMAKAINNHMFDTIVEAVS